MSPQGTQRGMPGPGLRSGQDPGLAGRSRRPPPASRPQFPRGAGGAGLPSAHRGGRPASALGPARRPPAPRPGVPAAAARTHAQSGARPGAQPVTRRGALRPGSWTLGWAGPGRPLRPSRGPHGAASARGARARAAAASHLLADLARRGHLADELLRRPGLRLGLAVRRLLGRRRRRRLRGTRRRGARRRRHAARPARAQRRGAGPGRAGAGPGRRGGAGGGARPGRPLAPPPRVPRRQRSEHVAPARGVRGRALSLRVSS